MVYFPITGILSNNQSSVRLNQGKPVQVSSNVTSVDAAAPVWEALFVQITLWLFKNNYTLPNLPIVDEVDMKSNSGNARRALQSSGLVPF